MEVQLSDLFGLYQLPSGRAWYAVEKVKAVEEAADFPDILKLADAVIAKAREARDVERRYQLNKELPQYGPRARALDIRVDRALSGLLAAIRAHADVFDGDAEDERAVAATELERELFPRGVAAITSLNYLAEHKTVTLLLERLAAGSEHGKYVDQLGLRHFVTKLAALNAEFGSEVDRPKPPPGPTWDQVREAQAALQGAILSLVAKVAGTFHGSDEESVTRRSAILRPIMEQQQILSREFSRRRAAVVPDVDPSTGEVEDPAEPTE